MAFNRRRPSFGEKAFAVSFLSLPFLIIIAGLSAWITHLVWIVMTLASDAGATIGQIVLGVIGAFMPPVGVIHGILIWFGVGF